MPMDNITFDLNQVFHDIIARMQEEGAFDHEAYDDLVEEVLEEKIELGELSVDDDIDIFKEQLRGRWPDAEASFSSGHDDAPMEQE